MRRAWITTTVLLLAIFATTVHFAIQLRMFDQIGPGPGFFPFWLAVIGSMLSVILIFQMLRSTDRQALALLPPLKDAIRPVSILVGIAIMAQWMDDLGYRISSAIFIVGLLIALGVRTWWLIALLALIGSLGIFHVFYFWLQVPLPYGAFGF